MNYSNAFLSLFFWIIIMAVLLSGLLSLFKRFCPTLINLEEHVHPIEPLREGEVQVQMHNIAGTEVVIKNGFVD